MNSDQRHPFSARLRAKIPLLENAGTNPVYQAFLSRRRSRGWFDLRAFLKPVGRNRSPLGCLTFVVLASLVGIPVALQSPFGSTRQTWIFSMILVSAAIVAFMWISYRNQRVIPLRAMDAFRVESTDSKVAFELWQAGVTGGEIVEAIVMESVRSTRIALGLFHLITAGIFCLVLIAPAPVWSIVIYVLLTALMAGVTALMTFPQAVYKSHRVTAKVLIARWRRTDEFMVRFQRAAKYVLVQVGIFMGFFALLIVLLPTLAYILTTLSTLLTPSIPNWLWLQILGIVFHGLIVIGGLSLAAFQRGRDSALSEKLGADATEAFEIYIRGEVIADPDARRTVREMTLVNPERTALHE